MLEAICEPGPGPSFLGASLSLACSVTFQTHTGMISHCQTHCTLTLMSLWVSWSMKDKYSTFIYREVQEPGPTHNSASAFSKCSANWVIMGEGEMPNISLSRPTWGKSQKEEIKYLTADTSKDNWKSQTSAGRRLRFSRQSPDKGSRPGLAFLFFSVLVFCHVMS